jgi:Zn-dependent protease
VSFLGIDPLLMLPGLLFGIVIHEYAHALFAKIGGDMTAAYQGRLSLNPLAHIDPIGTVILPLILLIMRAPLIGWAKPVPVNPLKFRKPEWDVVVSLAGPGSNFAMVIAAAILLKVLLLISVSISVPTVALQILVNFIFINILLGCFNLIPIPPLDGSHILFHYVIKGSSSALQHFAFLEQYGFLILVVLLFMTPLRDLFFQGIVGNIFVLVLRLVLG